MRYCFVRDGDYHWYLIPIEFRDDFYDWVEAMENCEDHKEKLDYTKYIINGVFSYSFENPKEIKY